MGGYNGNGNPNMNDNNNGNSNNNNNHGWNAVDDYGYIPPSKPANTLMNSMNTFDNNSNMSDMNDGSNRVMNNPSAVSIEHQVGVNKDDEVVDSGKESKHDSDSDASDISRETEFWKTRIVDLNQLKDGDDYELNPYFTAELSVQSDNEFEKFKKTPNLPYNEHHKPNLKPMSNRFRTSLFFEIFVFSFIRRLLFLFFLFCFVLLDGPNKYIYPPKNGPFGTCRRLDIDPRNYPKHYDMEDELFNNSLLPKDFVKSDNSL